MWRCSREVRSGLAVAQTSKSAVSRVSKPAELTANVPGVIVLDQRDYGGDFQPANPLQLELLPTWKSAIQQTWKSALQVLLFISRGQRYSFDMRANPFSRRDLLKGIVGASALSLGG